MHSYPCYRYIREYGPTLENISTCTSFGVRRKHCHHCCGYGPTAGRASPLVAGAPGCGIGGYGLISLRPAGGSQHARPDDSSSTIHPTHLPRRCLALGGRGGLSACTGSECNEPCAPLPKDPQGLKAAAPGTEPACIDPCCDPACSAASCIATCCLGVTVGRPRLICHAAGGSTCCCCKTTCWCIIPCCIPICPICCRR